MDHSHHYLKCASCTHQGCTCCQEFHTGKEWDMLKNAEVKVANDLSAVDDELELLNPEFKQLQARLAEVQNKIKSTLTHHSHLRKQQKFLKECGFKMSEHDSELLQILDEKSSEQPDPPVEEVQQLAATSDNPSDFNQILEELSAVPSSFWESADFSVGGIPSASDGIHPNVQ